MSESNSNSQNNIQPPLRKADSWAHQVAGYHFAMQRQGTLLGIDMGCGKSKIAVDCLVNRGCQRTLILCPVSVLGVWRRELERFAGKPIETLVLDKGSVGTKTGYAYRFVKLNHALGQPCAVVINYESMWRSPFIGWAMDIMWDAIVADECHKIKSYSARVTKAAANLGAKTRFRLGLTGTPMPHSPLDIFGQARFLDPNVFGKSFHKFRDRYARVNPLFPSKVDEWKNQEELQSKLSTFCFRVRAKDVLDLPPVIHEQRRCDLSPVTMRAYKTLEKEMIVKVAEGEVTPANGMVLLLRLQQITSGFIGGVQGDETGLLMGEPVAADACAPRSGSPNNPANPASASGPQAGVAWMGHEKRDLLSELLDGLDQREPFIVFCRFRHDLDAVREVAESLGRRYGELSGRRRDLTPHATMREDVDVMGVQIASGGVGIDLTRACYCTYYSIGFSLGDYEQSLARINRPGQTRTVHYYHLIANKTVDDVVYGALQARANLVESVLSALGRSPISREEDGHEQVETGRDDGTGE